MSERYDTEAKPSTDCRDEQERIGRIQAALLAWYRANGRDLPWRRTRDPYRVLVSEVMLQQTQVDRVIPKYLAFLEQFPTFEALAQAPAGEVIRAWSGLGYNRRAVNLQRAAQAVVERYAGKMPQTVAELQTLPGIGRYTAGAVACFAFGQDVGFFDTNIRRVLHRLFVGPELPAPRLSERELHALADRVVPPGDGYDWNQGLMEFGAVHCTARKPACITCPLQAECRAFPVIQTALAEAARDSSARKREPAFEGSSRYYRGRIVEALRTLPDGATADLASLGPRVREDFHPERHLPWLAELVEGLRQDGLAAVAEDAPDYDATDPASMRVRLPD